MFFLIQIDIIHKLSFSISSTITNRTTSIYAFPPKFEGAFFIDIMMTTTTTIVTIVIIITIAFPG